MGQKWIFTRDVVWYQKWDKLVLSDENSSFNQLSDRIFTYEKYGLKTELLLCIDSNEEIILGSNNIIANFGGVKMYLCSYGPTFRENTNHNRDKEIEEFLLHFQERAKRLRAFASQITIPTNTNINIESRFGSIFDFIPRHECVNLVNLKDNNKRTLDIENIISTFLPKGRRDVRASLRKGLSCKIAKSEAEIKEGYNCFVTNSKNKGYSVRTWNEMREFLIESIKKETSYLLTAWYEDEIQGAILIERSCNMLNYTMGGVYRHHPDLLTGYYLQLEAILLSSKLNLSYYNISAGGPPEVKHFKGMFNPTYILCGETIHFTHNKILYFIYKKIIGSENEF